MLEEPSPIGAIVSELTESVRSVFGLAGAAVLLPTDGELTVTAAAAPVQGLERAQQRSQRGPACEAQRRGAVVAVADLAQARGGGPNSSPPRSGRGSPPPRRCRCGGTGRRWDVWICMRSPHARGAPAI
jgi:hypothetical protein